MRDLIGLDFFAKVFYPSRLKARDDTLYCIGKKVDMDRNAYDSDLYRITQGQAVAMTASHDVKDYALLEEGIVFASLRKQKDQDAVKNGEPLSVFQMLPYDGGEAREYLRLPHAVEQAEWLGEGRLLFRGQYDHVLQSFLAEAGGDMEKALKAKKEQDEALTVLDEVPFWFNGQGFVNKTRTALYLYEKGEVRMLSEPNASIGRVVLNKDRSRALFTLVEYERMEPQTNELYWMDLKQGTIAKIEGVPEGSVEDYAFASDDAVVFLHSAQDAPHGLAASNPYLYTVALGGGSPWLLDDSERHNFHNSVGSDTKLGGGDNGLTVIGGHVYFISTLMHSSHIVRCDLATGESEQLTRAEGMVTEWIPYGEAIAMVAMRKDAPCEVYTLHEDGSEHKVSLFNDALMAGHEVVTPLPLKYTNKAGIEIEGWVMPPVGYVPGMIYPAIVDIHGGPKTAYGSVFFHEMQYWCAQGYAVLFCNPTGSDGRGGDFADIRGKYGTVEYEDIMGFVDEAVKHFGFISSVRMGVTGGSYGGFMTNWIIGHTDRFRAAASQRSISNWVGFSTTSDIGHFFGRDQIGATPWTDEKALWKASPLRYADKVTTPTLFIHSEEDYRCNMMEGIQMYYALQIFGVDTRLCLFKGENHELSRSGKPKNRIRRLQEITRWMDTYLKMP